MSAVGPQCRPGGPEFNHRTATGTRHSHRRGRLSTDVSRAAVPVAWESGGDFPRTCSALWIGSRYPMSYVMILCIIY